MSQGGFNRLSSGMVSSFLYQPHVYQSVNTIVTPDILVEHAYLYSTNSKTQVPISRLTSRTVLQRCSQQSRSMPSLVFIAADHGVLVTASVVFNDVIVIARQALRYSQLIEVWNNSKLRFRVTQDGMSRSEEVIFLSKLTSVSQTNDILGATSDLRAGTAVFTTSSNVTNDVVLGDHYEVGIDSSKGVLNLRLKIENIQ